MGLLRKLAENINAILGLFPPRFGPSAGRQSGLWIAARWSLIKASLSLTYC